MQVSALAVDPLTGLPVVVLRDSAGESSVAICIGLSEASAIAAELDGIELERPMTHQLMHNALDSLGVSICCVEVCDLVDNTFYAALHLETARGERVVQDARPSDALALALRAGAEVRVAVEVIEKGAGVGLCEPPEPDPEIYAGLEPELDREPPALALAGAREGRDAALSPRDEEAPREPIFEPGGAGAGGEASAAGDAPARSCDRSYERSSAGTLAILPPIGDRRGRRGQSDEIAGAEFLDALGDEVFGKWKM